MDEDAKHLRMKRNIFFLIIIGILLIGTVSAIAPVTDVTINLNDGLNIDFPKFETIQQGQDFLFHFHVFNISNGVRMNNTTTNCSFELYNYGGEEQVVVDEMEYIEGDWRVNITKGNFTRLGSYAYLVECHTTALGGYISFPFEVTPSGNDAPTDGEGMIYLGSLIAMVLVAGAFFFLSTSVKEYEGTKFAFISLGIITCMIIVLYSSVALSETFWGFDRIISSYSTFLWVFLFVIFIIFIFVLIMIIVKALDSMKIKKGLKE